MGISPVTGALAAALFATAAAVDSGYLRGVHYFGDAWPVNFWDSFRPAGAPADFRKIRENGFNTIVLVIPWGAFQPSIDPVHYDDQMFARLLDLLRTAERAGLRVALRLGYEWDFTPGVQLHHERYALLFSDDAVHAAWLEFLAEVWRRVGSEPNLAFGFVTWEDFWSFGTVTGGSPKDRSAGAGTTGYRAWLRQRHRLEDVGRTYGVAFQSWEDVPLPETRKPGYELFLAFQDHLLVERLFKPSIQRFPRLSMEVRVDQDPVIRDGKPTWVPHFATYALPGSPYTTTYYSVSWGADGPRVSRARALELMRAMLESVRARAQSPIFIDQFVPFDNTPGFEGNATLASEERAAFVVEAAANLRDLSSGYALWTYRDYASNAIYNARFELGLRGWQAGGSARLQDHDGDPAVLLPRRGRIRQHIAPLQTGVATFGAFPTARLCFWARPRRARSEVAVRFEKFAQVQVISGPGEYCLEVPRREAYDLSLETRSGATLVDDVRLYAFVAHGEFQALDGSPLQLLPAIRKLNEALAAGPVPESYDRSSIARLRGVYGDLWMGPEAKGEIRVPADVKRRVFRVVSSLPAAWPTEPILRVRIGSAELAVPCKRGGAVAEFAAATLGVPSGQVVPVEVSSPSSLVPQQHAMNADVRALACQVLELGFFGP